MIIFVGTPVSEAEVEGLIACSPAGNSFQVNFLKGLRHWSEEELQVVAVKPRPQFPRGKITERFRRGVLHGIPITYVPFINVPVLKQFTIMVALLFALLVHLRSAKGGRHVIVVYNIFAPFALAVLAASKVTGTAAVAMVADLPHGFYQFRGAKGVLERLDMFVQSHVLTHFSGVIALTSKTLCDFAAGMPSIVMEGGVPEGADEEPEGSDDERGQGERIRDEKSKICLYSGSLHEIDGIELLLSGFSLIDDPKLALHIYGDGPMAGTVAKWAAQDPRIQYFGRRAAPEVRWKQRRATLLLNLRATGNILSHYGFPSKLLEYMTSGRPTILTMARGIPEEYAKYLFVLDSETPGGLASLIRDVCSRPDQELTDHGRRACEFARGAKSWRAQSFRAYQFLLAVRKSNDAGTCRLCQN